jgi:hypothetical protein
MWQTSSSLLPSRGSAAGGRAWRACPSVAVRSWKSAFLHEPPSCAASRHGRSDIHASCANTQCNLHCHLMNLMTLLASRAVSVLPLVFSQMAWNLSYTSHVSQLCAKNSVSGMWGCRDPYHTTVWFQRRADHAHVKKGTTSKCKRKCVNKRFVAS